MADASGGSSEAIVASQSVLNGWLIPIMWRATTFIGGLFCLAVGALYYKQESLLYFPSIGGVPRRPGDNPRRYRSPAEHAIPYETHYIKCDDGINIHSWLLLHPHSKEKKLPTIVFFHGNAGNIGLRLPNAIQMFKYLQANVFMVEYRGYGDSDDTNPTEKGLKLDSEAALRFIRSHEHVDSSNIFAFGRSLGGAVAFHLARYAEQSGIPLAGIIVENTFLSISKMVDQLMPFLTPIKSLVLTLDWNSGSIAPQIQIPVLYLAGGQDELVPPSHMQALYKTSTRVSRCAKMHVVENGTHNDTWLHGGKAYWEAIRIFLSDNCGDGSGTDSSPVDVSASAHGESNVVPLMPTNLVGMASASAKSGGGGSSSNTIKKDL